jgi:hypothetical protein
MSLSTTCLRESDCDCKLSGASSVSAFANMVHFFPNKFSGMRRMHPCLPVHPFAPAQSFFFRYD